MGRNRPRAKGVDVTKRFLQPTSVADHITVQVGPSQVLQVTEEELSPTQGSETAFALRREGKLDTTMRLCHNWRQGGCSSFAACTFAHVNGFFNASAESTPPPHSSTSALAPLFPAVFHAGNTTVTVGAAAGREGPAVVAAPTQPSAKSWTDRLAQQHSSAATAPGPQVIGYDGADRPTAVPGLATSAGGTPTTVVVGTTPSAGLPARAQWGAPKPMSTADDGTVGFIDLQAAMDGLERARSQRSTGRRESTGSGQTPSVKTVALPTPRSAQAAAAAETPSTRERRGGCPSTPPARPAAPLEAEGPSSAGRSVTPHGVPAGYPQGAAGAVPNSSAPLSELQRLLGQHSGATTRTREEQIAASGPSGLAWGVQPVQQRARADGGNGQLQAPLMNEELLRCLVGTDTADDAADGEALDGARDAVDGVRRTGEHRAMSLHSVQPSPPSLAAPGGAGSGLCFSTAAMLPPPAPQSAYATTLYAGMRNDCSVGATAAAVPPVTSDEHSIDELISLLTGS